MTSMELANQQLRMVIVNEVKSHLIEYRRKTEEPIDIDCITQHYSEYIYGKMIVDYDYLKLLEEEGLPTTWELDWIREFVHRLSDLGEKFEIP